MTIKDNENLQMDRAEIKQMSIRVKCGTAEKELSFPVPADMVDWIDRLQLSGNADLDNSDPMKYTVDGSRKIKLAISIYDIRREF
jgi:hypothetical protein